MKTIIKIMKEAVECRIKKYPEQTLKQHKEAVVNQIQSMIMKAVSNIMKQKMKEYPEMTLEQHKEMALQLLKEMRQM